MSCDGIRANYLAGERSAQIEAHLRGCPSCRRALPDLDRVREQLQDPGMWEAVSPDLEQRVVESIRLAAPEPPSLSRRGRLGGRGRLLAAGLTVVVAAAVVSIALVATGSSDDPDWQVTLAPTDEAPGAAATVDGWNRNAGTEMRLDVHGLPASGPNSHYAIWLTATDGRHVAAGTFRSSGVVTAWAGVSRAEFPRIWVTLEPNDDDEALSGPTVLDITSS